jgi:hypothetical protein
MAAEQAVDAEQAVVAEPAVPARPVGGVRLGLSALWAAVRTFFRNLFRRSPGA